jgi:hypothetical protein
MGRTMLIGVVLSMAVGLTAHAQPPKAKQPTKPSPPAAAPQEDPAKRTTRVSDSLGFIIQKGTERGIEVTNEPGKSWSVLEGEAKLNNATVIRNGMRGDGAIVNLDPKLQIMRFASSPDTVVVQVDVSSSRRTPEFCTAFERAPQDRPPALVDTKGRKYEAVGFVYRDAKITHLRYTRGAPLRGLSEAPSVSRSTPDRELTLVFCVSAGAEVKEFRIGDVVVAYDPVVKCEKGGR